ncbi:MAG: hypothetical protein WCQ50_14705 [Spirochaetota bacterium]
MTFRKASLGFAALGFGLMMGLSAQSLPPGLNSNNTGKSDGPSGLKWTGGNRESQYMNPGLDCIACHSKGEGPRYSIAGTVYTNLDEKDLDFGVEGASVVITDSKGTVFTYKTNKAGNFMSKRSDVPAFPITAKVVFNGKEKAMATPQRTGDCMMCHSSAGKGGAPGRVIIAGK